MHLSKRACVLVFPQVDHLLLGYGGRLGLPQSGFLPERGSSLQESLASRHTRRLHLSHQQVLASTRRLSQRTVGVGCGPYTPSDLWPKGQNLAEAFNALHPVQPLAARSVTGVFSLTSVATDVALFGLRLVKQQRPALTLVLRGLKNKVGGSFLAFQANSGGVLGANFGPSQDVLTELSATSVASMFGYSRRYQRAHFVRLSFVKYLRRYLLVLLQLRANLGVVGTMRQFKAYFKVLNTPTYQVFRHPLTGGWVSDVALTLTPRQPVFTSRLELAASVRNLVHEHQAVLSDAPTEGAESSHALDIDGMVTDLVNFFWLLLSREPANTPSAPWVLCRYRLSWDQVVFKKGAAHGFKRHKRARSIKKRRTKRLVTKTKFRFWAA